MKRGEMKTAASSYCSILRRKKKTIFQSLMSSPTTYADAAQSEHCSHRWRISGNAWNQIRVLVKQLQIRQAARRLLGAPEHGSTG
jgi:hypothetical protein